MHGSHTTIEQRQLPQIEFAMSADEHAVYPLEREHQTAQDDDLLDQLTVPAQRNPIERPVVRRLMWHPAYLRVSMARDVCASPGRFLLVIILGHRASQLECFDLIDPEPHVSA